MEANRSVSGFWPMFGESPVKRQSMKDQRVAQLKKEIKARGKIEIEEIIKEELPDQQN